MGDSDVQRLLGDWFRAANVVESRTAELTRAIDACDEIAVHLADLLAPADIQRGEKIGVWTRTDTGAEVCIIVARAAAPHKDRLSLSVRRGTKASVAQRRAEEQGAKGNHG